MPPNTITLIDYLAAISEAMEDAGLLRVNGEHLEPDPSVDGLPVQVLFRSFEGTPIDFPVTGVGVKTNDEGQVIALVISCTQEGDFRAAAQNS